jgi:hypothetical protein
MYAEAGIDLTRRGQYLQRIQVLLQNLPEAELLALGKHIAGTSRKAA